MIILAFKDWFGMGSLGSLHLWRTQRTLIKNLNYTSLGRVSWVRWVRHTCNEPSEPSEPYLIIFDFYNFEYKSLKNHIWKILELVHLHT